MKLEFSTKQMVSAIKAVKKMFDKGPFSDDPTSDDCLVASVDDGTIMLESAASGLYAKATFAADVKRAGRVSIDRATLHGLRLQGDRSSFWHETGTSVLRFRSGQFVGELGVSDAFGAIEAARPVDIPALTIRLSALVAKAAAKRTCLTPTVEPIVRMKLTLEDSPKRMTLSCNDTFRAAAVRADVDEESEGSGEIEMPAVFLTAVLQAIDDTHVHIGVNHQYFRIAGGGFDVCHAVLQRRDKPLLDVFAEIARYRNDEPLVTATLDTAALRDAIASVTSVVASSNIELDLMFSEKDDGQLTTVVRSPTGTGKFTLPARQLRVGSRVPIRLEAKFINEMLTQLGTDEVTLTAFDKVVVLEAEKVGCAMIVPKLKLSGE